MTRLAILILLSLTYSLSAISEELISKADIEQLLPAQGVVVTESIEKTLDIGHGISAHYTFEITSKGNGAINLPGVLIRLYDRHSDLSMFKNGLIKNELIDLNADGYKDIVLWGTALSFDDEGKALGESEALGILIFSATEKKYILLRKSEQIEIFAR